MSERTQENIGIKEKETYGEKNYREAKIKSSCPNCKSMGWVADIVISGKEKGLMVFKCFYCKYVWTCNDEKEKVEMRKFKTGATRDNNVNKLDYEGFNCPLVDERYAQYLNKHRVQADGKIRESDNWQKGIPLTAYIKSAFRHFVDWRKQHRKYKGQDLLEDSICALIFNAKGYLHELLKKQK